MIMKNAVNLPLYNEFLEIFDKHKIVNWQAKNFWQVMELNKLCEERKCRRQMYAGLKVLVRCQYLKIDTDQSSKQLFMYSETPRLEELRKKYRNAKLDNIFSRKKILFLDEVEEKEANINFIKDLLSNDNSLEKYFVEVKEVLEKDIRKLKSNIKLMDSIINNNNKSV